MKNTVFTVMTVLLMLLLLATIAPMQTAAFELGEPIDEADDAAPKWELDRSFSGPRNDPDHDWIYDIVFLDNNTIFYGRGSQLIKWRIVERRMRWRTWPNHAVAFAPEQNQVTSVTLPKNQSSIVIHGVGDQLHIRNTGDLSLIDWAETYDNVYDLDTDNNGNYVVGRSVASPNRYFTFDLWGHNGWQLERNTMDERRTSAAAIHPELLEGGPHRYFCFRDDPDVIREKVGRQWRWGDTYTTAWAPSTAVAEIEAGRFRGDGRIIGLLEDDRIDVWNWTGNLLFTFNVNQARNLNPNCLEFTPNGELLVTATQRSVILWDMSTRREHPSSFATDIPADSQITAIAISENGKILAVGESQGDIYLYRWTGDTAPAAPAKEAETQPTALLSNYPNPFNPETWIPYQLSEAAEVTVTIHASDGKLVRTLELGQMPAGAYSDKERAAYWDGRNAQGEPVASGVYFYTLTAGDFSATRKMVIRK